MEKEALQLLAENTMFTIKDNEIEHVAQAMNIFLKQIEAVHQIDTEGIEPMHFPMERINHYLREDVPTKAVTVDCLLANAPATQSNQIVVPVVVKR